MCYCEIIRQQTSPAAAAQKMFIKLTAICVAFVPLIICRQDSENPEQSVARAANFFGCLSGKKLLPIGREALWTRRFPIVDSSAFIGPAKQCRYNLLAFEFGNPFGASLEAIAVKRWFFQRNFLIVLKHSRDVPTHSIDMPSSLEQPLWCLFTPLHDTMRNENLLRLPASKHRASSHRIKAVNRVLGLSLGPLKVSGERKLSAGRRLSPHTK